MMYCKHCGTSLPDEAKFCSDCGQSLTAQSDTDTFQSDHEQISIQPLLAYNNTALQQAFQASEANRFDILLQFDQATMKDFQIRSLNTSLATNLWLKSPLSRVINHPIPPLEVKAHWNKPQVSVQKDRVEISAEVKGGARQTLTGHIFTIDGEVSAKQRVIVESDKSGRPYVCLKAPDPLHLHLKDLKMTYEGSTWSSLLAKLDLASEKIVLRPVLTQHLMEPLASIPLTFFPRSLPIGTQAESKTPSPTLPVTQALTNIVQKSGSLTLGLMLDASRLAPTSFTPVLPGQSQYNAALSISTAGLNALIAHLCQQGEATGKMDHTLWGDVTWQWEQLAVNLQLGRVQLAGILLQRGQRTIIQAEVQCSLDKDGILRCAVLASNTEAAIAEIVHASWLSVLRRLLAVPEEKKRSQDLSAQGKLWQYFDLPGTQSSVKAIALNLRVIQDQLAIFYRLPKTQHKIQLELPPEKPTITLVQTHIPQQPARGAPVTVQLEAKMVKESTPPYDHVWTTGLSPQPKAEQSTRLTSTEMPKPVVRLTPSGGKQTLTTVHLKVIDMFGQMSEVHGEAKYIPYHKTDHKKASQERVGLTACIFAVLLLILCIVPSAAASPATPPTLALCSSSPSASVHLGPVVEGESKAVTAIFQLCTHGSGLVHWSSSWDTKQAPWLLLVRSGQVQAPQTQTVQLSASAASLTAGNYTTAVTFSSLQSTVKIPLQVTLTVLDQKAQTCIRSDTPNLTLTSTSGQGSPAQQSLTLSNCGDSGDWSAVTTTDDGASWLSVNPDHGTLQKGASQDILVTATATRLVAGTYTGHITFGSGSNIVHTDVTFMVINRPQATPPPGPTSTPRPTPTPTPVPACFNVSPLSISMTTLQGTSDPSPQSIAISDPAPCSTGSWRASPAQSWLSVTPTSGQTASGGSGTASIAAHVTGLTQGNYTGYVYVYTPNSTITVTVNLTIQPPPCVTLSAYSLSFSGDNVHDPAPQTVTVTNCGPVGTLMPYVIMDNTNNGAIWLTVSGCGGQLNPGGSTTCTITATSSILIQGTYTGSVYFPVQYATGSFYPSTRITLTVGWVII